MSGSTVLGRSTTNRPRGWRCLTLLLAIGLAAVSTTHASSAQAAVPTSAHRPVALAATASGNGYWIAAADGGVFSFGDATFYGSMGGQTLAAPVVGMAGTPSGHGYWLVASDGGVFAYGDAAFHGSMGGQALAAPIVGIRPTPSGAGYWLVAADGGVFAYGDATFLGSMGGQHLNAPVVDLAPTRSGAGYWLVAADGGVFAYGDATFRGSMGGQHLNAPVIGIATSARGAGYFLVAADGGLFAYGDATYRGNLSGVRLAGGITGLAAGPRGGYWMLGADGGVFAFGMAPYLGRISYDPGSVDADPVPAAAGGYAMVLPSGSFTAKSLQSRHHPPHAAIDIPVAVGTNFYAITSGMVSNFTQAKLCGWGVQLAGDDGAVYVYCHASEFNVVRNGARVTAGDRLGRTGGAKGAPGAGDSTGPHLHLQLKVAGQFRCPQAMLQAIDQHRTVPAPTSLLPTGCTG